MASSSCSAPASAPVAIAGQLCAIGSKGGSGGGTGNPIELLDRGVVGTLGVGGPQP